MITTKEKRFLKYWEDQKAGGKWQYILVYTIGWSVILFIVPLAGSFVIDMYSALKLYQLPLWASILVAVSLGFAGSIYFWDRNEKKAKDLLQKQNSPG